MAYKYFTKALLDSGLVDLNSVFPDKQKLAQEQNNVVYNLAEIVDYLRTSTENFKVSEQKYIDLDNAIRSIIDKYYKSLNENNPFEDRDTSIVADNTYVSGNAPREAAEVKEGKIRSRGVPKGAEALVPAPKEVAAIENIEEATVVEPTQGIEEESALPVSVPLETEETLEGTEAPEISEVAEVEEEKAPPTHEEIMDAIETLKLLADDGDEEAIEAIETLKLLLEE